MGQGCSHSCDQCSYPAGRMNHNTLRDALSDSSDEDEEEGHNGVNFITDRLTGEREMHKAVKDRNINYFMFLVDNKADVNCQTLTTLETPLHIASKMNDVRFIRLLLSCGANPNIKNKDGKTAIDLSSKHTLPEFEKYKNMKTKNIHVNNHLNSPINTHGFHHTYVGGESDAYDTGYSTDDPPPDTNHVNISQFSSHLGITDGTPLSPEAKTEAETEKEVKGKAKANTKAKTKTKKRTKQRRFTDESPNSHSHSHPHPGQQQQHHQEQHNTINNSTANDVASVATQIALMDPPSIYISSDGEHGDVHPNSNPNIHYNNNHNKNKQKNSHAHHHQQQPHPHQHPHPQYPIFTTIDHVSVPPIPEANSYNVLKNKGKDNDHNHDSSRESTPRRSKKKYRVELSPRLSASSREQSVTSLNSNISLNTAATMEDNEVVFTARFDDSYGGDMRTSVFVAHGAAESNNYESSDYGGAININSNSLSNKGKSKIDSSYINSKNGNFKTKKRRGKHKVYTSGSSNMFDHGGYIVEDFADMYQSNATDQD